MTENGPVPSRALTHEIIEALLLDDAARFFEIVDFDWSSKELYFETRNRGHGVADVEPFLEWNPPVVCVAAFYGCLSVLKELARMGVPLTDRDEQKRNVVHFCAAKNQVVVLNWLRGELEENAFFEVDDCRRNIIHLAALSDAYDVMVWCQTLVPLSFYDARSKFGYPIHNVCRCRAFRCFEFLANLNLQYKAQHPGASVQDYPIDFNRPWSRKTPLMDLMSFAIEMIPLGKAAGMRLDDPSSYGLSAMHFAVRSGNITLVELLHKLGASTNVFSDGNVAPIHFAAMRRDRKMCRKLVELGADPHVFTKFQRTPFLLATSLSRQDPTLETARDFVEYEKDWLTKALMLHVLCNKTPFDDNSK